MKYLIGNSYDIHNLIQKEEGSFILGGIKIDSIYKIKAVSNGDILIHAISEAIIGALGKGDLGNFFLESKSKNANSLELMFPVIKKLLKENQYKISNIDVTIILEQVILSQYKDKIRDNLIKNLDCKQINIKATRWENKTNFQIAVLANVLLIKED